MSTRSGLAEALRAWRRRLPATTVGLADGRGRRVPGLRREELASRAGVSVDYLIRLEQGKARNPSPRVIDALARALRLSGQERQLLHSMAGAAASPAGVLPRQVSEGVRRMTDRLADIPVAVYTAAWDLLEANALWNALNGDSSSWVGRDGNLVWRHFTGGRPSLRQTDEELAVYEREIVADLRLASAAYPEDRELDDLVEALLAVSAVFAERWQRFDVLPRVSGHKTFEHEMVGCIALDCEVLTVAGGDLKLSVFTAVPGSVDAERLDVLRVLGPQRTPVDDAHGR